MKIFFNLTVLLLLCWGTTFAQSADPAISGGNFESTSINASETTNLIFSFANNDFFSEIPTNSIRISIEPATAFYTAPNIPTGAASHLFDWTRTSAGVWEGINNASIGAFGGGTMEIEMIGVASTNGQTRATNVSVIPIANPLAFSNSTANDAQNFDLIIGAGTTPPCNGNLGAVCTDANGQTSTIGTDCECTIVAPSCTVGSACTDLDGDASTYDDACHCIEVSTPVTTGAEPAILSASCSPEEIEVGQTSTLTINFINNGSTIPANSIEVLIGTANNFYTSDGTTAPTGAAASLFDWQYLGPDAWLGINNTAINTNEGGVITMEVTGTAVSPSAQITNVSVQPFANLGAFSNDENNDNAQPSLHIKEATMPTCTVGGACTDTDGDASIYDANCGCIEVSTPVATDADPAIISAAYDPSEIEVGALSTLSINFSNEGTSAIPVGSIEFLIGTANNFYTSDGVNSPSGTAASLFDWQYLGPDAWLGINNTVIDAGIGGTVSLLVRGTAASPAAQITNVSVQPAANLGAFSNDENNDNAQPTLQVVEPAIDCDVSSPIVSIVKSIAPTCAGGSDGMLEFDVTYVTSPGAERILWDNGLVNSRILNNATAGTYTFTAFDANGCSAQIQTTLTDPASVVVTASNIVGEECTTFGSVALNATGGNGPYTYEGSLTAATQNGNISDLSAGNYTVKATDANGCMSATINIVIINNCGCTDADKDGVCAQDDCNDNSALIGEVTGGSLATAGGMIEKEICAGDGQSDAFDVTLSGNEGSQTAWVITNDNREILVVPAAPPFDLEGAGAGTCFIYHISYEGTLTGLTPGNNISDLSGCFALSNRITVIRKTGADCAGCQCTADGDNTPPVLAGVPGDVTINVNNGDITPEVNVTATDNCDPNPVVNFAAPSILPDPCSNRVTFPETWSATDICGNTSASQTRMVTIINDAFFQDEDGDGVCDPEDMCPGADDNLDSDDDGTVDCKDACPNDSNKTEPGTCGCGIADADSDGDGVLDCNDITMENW